MIFIPFTNRNSDPNWLREAADEEYEASCPCPYVVRLVTHVVAPMPLNGASAAVNLACQLANAAAQEKGAGAAEEVAGSHDHLLAVDGPLDHVAKA
jgi:hypothetical protein